MLRVSEDGNHRRESSVANYRQLRQSLIDLQLASDRIFDSISDRIVKEREKLTDLSTRIQKAKGKIDAISHSKQSITVRSCARYPSNLNGEEDFRSLFGYNDGAAGADFPVAKLLVNGGLNREFGIDGTLELYKFFSETSEFLPMEVQTKYNVDPAYELLIVPTTKERNYSKSTTFAKHIVNTPKFPSFSFPMEDHIAVDSLQNPKHQALPPPPPSLLLHNSRSLPRSKGFSFSPLVKQLQSLKLPEILPSLPMVSDMAFSGIDDHQPEEKLGSSLKSSQVMPHLPPSGVASPSQKQHSSSGSGATTTYIDNSQLVSSLPLAANLQERDGPSEGGDFG